MVEIKKSFMDWLRTINKSKNSIIWHNTKGDIIQIDKKEKQKTFSE